MLAVGIRVEGGTHGHGEKKVEVGFLLGISMDIAWLILFEELHL